MCTGQSSKERSKQTFFKYCSYNTRRGLKEQTKVKAQPSSINAAHKSRGCVKMMKEKTTDVQEKWHGDAIFQG